MSRGVEMRRALFAIAATACGCGEKRPVFVEDMSERRLAASVERLLAASASHDVATLEGVLDGEVTYGGLWFRDEACRALVPGKVKASELAPCLAPLALMKSKRAHPFSNVTVLMYAPGIEIDVLFDLASAKVKWIGFAGRRATDTLPSVTGEALEALRIDPGPVVLPPKAVTEIEADAARWEVPPKRVRPYAWVKVCIDAAGDITDVQPRSAFSLKARDAFVAQVGTWRFHPFLLDGQPAAVCALVSVVHGPAATPEDTDEPELPFPTPENYAEAVAIPLASIGKLVGKRLIQPDDKDKTEFYKRGYKRIGAELRLCVDTDGRVGWVQMTVPSRLERYDAELLGSVATWRFAPPPPEPVCSSVRFIYSQRYR